MMYPMNWVILVCFLVATVAVLTGLGLVGRQLHRLYRKVQEAQQQITPPIEALVAGQERAMILADKINRRQEDLVNQLQETGASVESLASLLGELQDAQEQLTTMDID
jgi:uncharacterized membrane protein YcjF (UPF0283 family)